VVISPPYAWQVRLNKSGVAVEPRIEAPVDARIVDQLHGRFADFRHAYDEDGIAISDFDGFGPTRRTLRQFLAASSELDALVRDVMVPDPEK
jgi:transaldolase